MRISAVFNGTGAALTLGLGFIPDWVRLTNITAADAGVIDWHRKFGAANVIAGGRTNADSTGIQLTARAGGAGIEINEGGNALAASSSANQILADLIEALAGDMRNKTGTLVDSWILDTAGNRTGHVNAGVSTTYIGAGTVLLINKKQYTIQAMSNDGDAANEITLDRAAPSGPITLATYMLGFGNAPVGQVMPAGIIIRETAIVNVSNERVLLEAGTDDR